MTEQLVEVADDFVEQLQTFQALLVEIVLRVEVFCGGNIYVLDARIKYSQSSQFPSHLTVIWNGSEHDRTRRMLARLIAY